MFAACFWHKAILEAVLKRARTTKHPWLMACDATMSPEDFEKTLWFRKDQMHVLAPAGVSTCRSKNTEGEWVEVYDHVIACNSLQGKIAKMKVLEDYESRPPTAVSFVVERGKERQEWSEQRMPNFYTHTVEEGFQGEAQKKKVGKKERRTEEAKKDESETKSLKKFLKAFRRGCR